MLHATWTSNVALDQHSHVHTSALLFVCILYASECTLPASARMQIVGVGGSGRAHCKWRVNVAAKQALFAEIFFHCDIVANMLQSTVKICLVILRW